MNTETKLSKKAVALIEMVKATFEGRDTGVVEGRVVVSSAFVSRSGRQWNVTLNAVGQKDGWTVIPAFEEQLEDGKVRRYEIESLIKGSETEALTHRMRRLNFRAKQSKEVMTVIEAMLSSKAK